MRITDLLKEQGIELNAKVKDKSEAIEKLVDLMDKTGNLSDKNEYKKTVLAREELSTTGIGDGIAIPHAKSDLVSSLITMIAISPNGIDFDSLDGDSSTIFVATLSPTADTNSHIKFLAEVSRNLSSKKLREKLLKATTREEMKAAICE